MNNEQKALILSVRINKLKTNMRNLDSQGVIHKLERQLRNLKEEKI